MNPDNSPVIPGALRGESWIILQSRQAQKLFEGRNQSDEHHGVTGLTRFGSQVSAITWRARWDDPYADWWLVQIEEEIRKTKQELKTLQKTVDQALSADKQLEYKTALSLDPVRLPLKFRDTYAYLAAGILTDYDKLICSAMTAGHVAMLTPQDTNIVLAQAGKAVRRTFESINGFYNRSVTRKDMQDNNARAREAQQLMGSVPLDILSGEYRAEYAPKRLCEKQTTKAQQSKQQTHHTSLFSRLFSHLSGTTRH